MSRERVVLVQFESDATLGPLASDGLSRAQKQAITLQGHFRQRQPKAPQQK